MQVSEIAVTALSPYEKNPRNNEAAIEPVMASISAFGFKVPIVIDSNNVIVCGHTRWKAAQRLGLERVPCIVADDLTDEQLRAFRLADNKVSEIATWDLPALEVELSALADFGMGNFGFDLGDPQDVAAEEANVAPLQVDHDLLGKYDKFYFAFSGGRDSTLTLYKTVPLLKAEGKEMEALFVDTGAEFLDLIPFMQRTCEKLDVPLKLIKGERNFFDVYGKKKRFPDSIFRESIELLINSNLDRYTEAAGVPYVLIRGGRKKQTTGRSKSAEIAQIKSKPLLTMWNPLFNLTDDEYEKDIANIPIWRGYSMGFDRTACWCCPFQTTKQWDALKEHYPLCWEELNIMMNNWEFPEHKGDAYLKRINKYWRGK